MGSIGSHLLTSGVTFVALGIWFALFQWNRRHQVTTRQLLAIIIIVGFVCRMSFLVFTPDYYAPDEQSHFKYVQFLVENRALPVQSSRTNDATNDWEYYQPPLYYLVLAPLYGFSGSLFHDPAITIRVLRGLSIILWGITTLLGFNFVKRLEVDDSFTQIFAMGMICLLPTYIFLSSVINNDNLLICIGGAVLCRILWPKDSLWYSAGTGVLLGLALLTKLTAIIYIVLLAFRFLVRLARREARRSTLAHAVLPIILAALIWSPWGVRNWLIYGSLTAEEVANVPKQWASVREEVYYVRTMIERSFWAVSGIYNDVFARYPIAGRFISYLAVIGWLGAAYLKGKRLPSSARKNSVSLIALALTIAVNLMLTLRFGLLYAQGQGRFLFPMLIPLALFLALGLRSLPWINSESWRIHAVGFWSVYAMSFTAFSLTQFPRV